MTRMKRIGLEPTTPCLQSVGVGGAQQCSVQAVPPCVGSGWQKVSSLAQVAAASRVAALFWSRHCQLGQWARVRPRDR